MGGAKGKLRRGDKEGEEGEEEEEEEDGGGWRGSAKVRSEKMGSGGRMGEG